MLVIIKGNLQKRNMVSPDKGKPHQALFLVQESPTAIEVVKIKDFDLNRDHKVGVNVAFECAVRNWAFDGRDGLSVTLFKVLGSAAGSQDKGRPADKNQKAAML